MSDNPPAFPRDHRHLGHNGMTLRDWFAGQALPSLLYDKELMAGYCDIGPKAFAEAAYDIANAMLAARLTQEENQ